MYTYIEAPLSLCTHNEDIQYLYNRTLMSKCCIPGGERTHRSPEAGNPPGPAFPEGLFYQLALRGRVDPPEGALAWLLLRASHFDEVPVQGQVVSDRVLQHQQIHMSLKAV